MEPIENLSKSRRWAIVVLALVLAAVLFLPFITGCSSTAEMHRLEPAPDGCKWWVADTGALVLFCDGREDGLSVSTETVNAGSTPATSTYTTAMAACVARWNRANPIRRVPLAQDL